MLCNSVTWEKTIAKGYWSYVYKIRDFIIACKYTNADVCFDHRSRSAHTQECVEEFIVCDSGWDGGPSRSADVIYQSASMGFIILNGK